MTKKLWLCEQPLDITVLPYLLFTGATVTHLYVILFFTGFSSEGTKKIKQLENNR